MENLDSLYLERKNIEFRLDNFFDDGEFFPTDQGYQDLLVNLEDVQEKINEIVGYDK